MARNILVTGRPGAGKTTLVQKVIAAGIPLAGGFVTEEVRQGGRRAGFRVEDLRSGVEGALAHVSRKGRPRVGKYGVDVASFDRVGVGALRDAAGRPGCIVIDEIGKMELCSSAFREAVTAALDCDAPVLATIPIYRLGFVDQLRARQDVLLIEITHSNREALVGRLAELLGGGTP